MPQVILLCGPIGVGKDTVGRFLTDNHQFVRIGFADAVKRLLSEEMKVPLTAWDSRDFKNAHRGRLIERANRLRDYDPDYWVKMSGIEYHLCQNKDIVVTDTRFISEIKKVGEIARNFEAPLASLYLWDCKLESAKHKNADFIALNRRMQTKHPLYQHPLITQPNCSHTLGFHRMEKESIKDYLTLHLRTFVNPESIEPTDPVSAPDPSLT